MASTKPSATTRRRSPATGSKKGDGPAVSPARWGGVLFVIAAIVAAAALAVMSPVEPGPPQTAAVPEQTAPSPTPTAGEVPAPTAQPQITNPKVGKTREKLISVTVDLPKEELPRRELTLDILRGGEIVHREDRPKTGEPITVHDVPLVAGDNELVAVLSSLGGPGPRSEPVLVTLDTSLPPLEITAPDNKHETYDDAITVEGTSEVGADVVVRNEAADFEQKERVGPGGEFDLVVRLKKGRNSIVATSVDDAGLDKEAKIRVIRLDGAPKVKVRAIDPIKRSTLPADVRVVVTVTDARDRPLADAEVHFSLSAFDRTSLTETLITNDNGRAVWRPTVEPAGSAIKKLQLAVTVTSPASGDMEVVSRDIELA